MRRPRPKFKVSFYLYFGCFWMNVTQINFENIKRKIQRIISDSCFQLKLWFNVDARAPSIPLLNSPFKWPSLYPIPLSPDGAKDPQPGPQGQVNQHLSVHSGRRGGQTGPQEVWPQERWPHALLPPGSGQRWR